MPPPARRAYGRGTDSTSEGDMTDQHVDTVNRMTQAILDGDEPTLQQIYTPDFQFHLRAPFPKAGDHRGAAGVLEAIGALVEATGGDIKLDQKFCLAHGNWAVEWEHAALGRNGATLESDNAFVYRFEDGRIAEMWMLVCAPPGSESFFA
jgi:ketosteroid isomerase-like protein